MMAKKNRPKGRRGPRATTLDGPNRSLMCVCSLLLQPICSMCVAYGACKPCRRCQSLHTLRPSCARMPATYRAPFPGCTSLAAGGHASRRGERGASNTLPCTVCTHVHTHAHSSRSWSRSTTSYITTPHHMPPQARPGRQGPGGRRLAAPTGLPAGISPPHPRRATPARACLPSLEPRGCCGPGTPCPWRGWGGSTA